MDLGLEGKRVIITGGSRGIGAATASVMASEGAQVAVIGRDRDALASVVETCGAHAVTADLSTAAGVVNAIDESREALGGVDVLVNNAGASLTGSFDDVSDEAWEDSLNLKLLGYVRAMRQALPTMRAQGHGCVINVGGTAGIRATPVYALAAINAAIVHLTRTTAELVGPDGVRVVAVHPGPTLTDRLEGILAPSAASHGLSVRDYAEQVAGGWLPLRRLGTPLEVGSMIAVLASDVASWVTGGGLCVDGGASIGVVGG
jgi:3-oxoacyl-[acyl-carrier protein] reductase